MDSLLEEAGFGPP